MKIKFKDTLIKENLLTYIMLLCAIGGVITSLLMSQINWTGAIWALGAAIAVWDLIYVDTLRLTQKRDLKQELQTAKANVDVLTDLHVKDQRQINELQVRVDDLRKQRSDYAAKHEDVQGQLQALDNEYQKLAKQHNAQGEELSKLKKEYDSLVQSLPFEAPVPMTPPVPKKNPVTATSKRAKYTKKDIARIHEEMKTGGMIKDEV